MHTPRLPELTLALGLACAQRPSEPMATVRIDTHGAIQKAIETPLNEADAIILEMETALKEFKAPPCEPPNGPRKARLKEAIAKAQVYLAKKGNSITIGNLDCSPITLAVMVGILTEELKKSESTVLAQAQ